MNAEVIFGLNRVQLKKIAGIALAVLVACSGMGVFKPAAVYAEEYNSSYTIYTVEKGDNLQNIAERFGVTTDEIAADNNLTKKGYIQLGQLLKIKSTASRTRDLTNRGGDSSATADKSASGTTGQDSSSVSGLSGSESTAPKTGYLSFNMVNMDIRDVLSAIAMSMDANILYLGDPVTVSFKVDNVTATKALELLIQSVSTSGGSLGYLKDGNIIIVGSQAKLQKDFLNKMALTRFRVNYISPEELSAQLDKLGVQVQKITLDQSSKYIWAQGLPQSLAKVAQVIAALDKAENFDTGTTTQLKASFSLTPYSLDYITADKLDELVSKLGLKVSTITIATNPKVLWASGSAQGLKDLEQLILKVDVSQSAGETFEMEACRLTCITYDKLIGVVAQLQLPGEIVRVGSNQKALWLKGTAKEIADLQDLVAKLDVRDNGEQYQYFVYALKYISPVSAVEKLDFLAIGDVKAIALNYADFSHEILVKCPQDMKSTMMDILSSIDIPGKKICVPVDSSNAINGYYLLTNRKALINKLTGISLNSMFVSDNVSKSATSYFVLWIDETPENVKLVRSMISQIDNPQ